jgi:hypothetical protein
VVVASFKVLSWYLLGEAEENQECSQSGEKVSVASFEARTTLISNRSADYSTAIFSTRFAEVQRAHLQNKCIWLEYISPLLLFISANIP